MITIEELKATIQEAKKIEGHIYISKSSNKVSVYAAPMSFHSVQLAHNRIYYWFRTGDVGPDGRITVNNHSPQEIDFTYTLAELVSLANQID